MNGPQVLLLLGIVAVCFIGLDMWAGRYIDAVIHRMSGWVDGIFNTDSSLTWDETNTLHEMERALTGDEGVKWQQPKHNFTRHTDEAIALANSGRDNPIVFDFRRQSF